MPVKVSVVVPVYNPGQYIEPCIRSVLDQSLPPDEYEAIFVDDGSTDETPALLDRLSAEHRNIRVIHIPASGWPGKPRNVGVDNALGEYVQFLDADDHLAPEALERLYLVGQRNRSDIVIGKVASNFRGVPQGLMRRDRDSCTIRDAPLIDSLTPHKMFRTEFLREHNIRFPEGKRRLEDQLFMVRSYFRAEVVSILASYTCYFFYKRADGKNIASAPIEPASYYANLREILDVIVANTEPGEFRNKLLRRFYRLEMLGRLGEPAYPKHEPVYRRELFDAVRELAIDLDDELEVGLGAVLQIRSRLVRDNRPDDLLEFTRRCAALDARVEIDGASWREGRLDLSFAAQFKRRKEESALMLLRRGERYFLDPWLTRDLLSEPLDVTAAMGSLRVDLFARNAATAVEWQVPAEASVELLEDGVEDGDVRIRPVMRVTASVNPQEIAARQPLERGTWEFRLRLSGFGLDRRIKLRHVTASDVEAAFLPALLGAGPQLVVPYLDEKAHVLLDVDRHTWTLGRALAGRPIDYLSPDGRSIRAALPVACSEDTAPSAAEVVVRPRSGDRQMQATLEPTGEALVLVARVPQRPRLPHGLWPLVARLDGDGGPDLVLGRIAVQRSGRAWIEGAGPLGGERSALVRHYVRTVRREARRIARKLVRRAPKQIKRVARRAYRSLQQ